MTDSPVPQPDTSRAQLRLRHIFVLTAVAAVLLAIVGRQFSNPQFSDKSPALRALVIGDTVFSALLGAAVLTAAGYCIFSRQRGAAVFCHPGHWLLIVRAASVVALFSGRLFSSWWIVSGSFEMPVRAVATIMLFSTAMIFQFGPSILSLYIGIKKCNQQRWKWVFFLLAAAGLLLLLIPWVATSLDRVGLISYTPVVNSSAIGLSCGQLIVLAYAITVDRQERLPRDAMHWCGVGLYAATSLRLLVVVLGWWLFT